MAFDTIVLFFQGCRRLFNYHIAWYQNFHRVLNMIMAMGTWNKYMVNMGGIIKNAVVRLRVQDKPRGVTEKLLRILSRYKVETHNYQYPLTLDIKRSSDSKQLPSLSCSYISVLATSYGWSRTWWSCFPRRQIERENALLIRQIFPHVRPAMIKIQGFLIVSLEFDMSTVDWSHRYPAKAIGAAFSADCSGRGPRGGTAKTNTYTDHARYDDEDS
jgi:hypothetical protein